MYLAPSANIPLSSKSKLVTTGLSYKRKKGHDTKPF